MKSRITLVLLAASVLAVSACSSTAPTATHGSSATATPVVHRATAYVVNSYDNTVTPIDLADPYSSVWAAKDIPVGAGPTEIAITPDGRTAYVVNSDDGTVTPIDLSNNTPGSPIQVAQ